jgi:hypothetical protein
VGDTERAKRDHRDSDRRAGFYGAGEVAKIANAIDVHAVSAGSAVDLRGEQEDEVPPMEFPHGGR